MVDAHLARAGKISYLQIPAADPLASAAFYRDVFGWKVGDNPRHVSFADAGGELIGAFTPGRAISETPGILPFVYVEDIDTAIAAAEAHGGALVTKPYDEGPLKIAHVRDVAGNVIGIWRG